MQSLIDCIRADVFEQTLVHMAGPYLDVARNVIVEKFYNDNCGEYLLFVDSDISFTPQNVYDLLDHATPDRITSGVYYSYFGEFAELRPVLGRHIWDPKHQRESIKPIVPRILQDVDAEGLVRVDGCGAGFMLFHRNLVKEMLEVFGYPMPWFITQCIDKTQQWYGEDYMFCLRAAYLGYTTFAVPSVRVGHSKVVQL